MLDLAKTQLPLKRKIYILLGCLCVAIGTVGIAVPGLPTTPLLLAASWFFYRSSAKLQQWLLGSRLGIYIRNYHKRGGMRPLSKFYVVTLMAAMITCSVVVFIDSTIVDWIVVAAGVIGSLVVIFAVPTAK